MKDLNITLEEEDSRGRLVAKSDGNEAGEMTFSIANEGELWIVDHTGINKDHESTGVGKQLFQRLVEVARKENHKIMPLCPFVRSMFERNRDQWDVLRHGSL